MGRFFQHAAAALRHTRAQVGKPIKTLFWLALALHAGIALIKLPQHRANEHHPLQQKLQEEFGIRLYGNLEGLHLDGSDATHLMRAIQNEAYTRPFDLQTIRIEPNNYWDKYPGDQLRSFVSTHDGYFFPPGHINVDMGASIYTVHHEIKHDKTFDLPAEFFEEWEQFTLDDNGNSLYLTKFESILTWTRGLNDFVSKEKKNIEVNRNLGFVTNYARTNFLEDIAELGEMAEGIFWSHGADMYNWIHGPEANWRIQGKVRLLEEYSMIPKGFTEYVNLAHLNQECMEGRNSFNQANINIYMQESEAFLEKYPESIYTGEIVYNRVYFGTRKGISGTTPEAIEQMRKEIIRGLNTPIKFTAYPLLLEELEKLADMQGDSETGDAIHLIHRGYIKRLNEGDLDLATRGVNDLLIEEGIFTAEELYQTPIPDSTLQSQSIATQR